MLFTRDDSRATSYETMSGTVENITDENYEEFTKASAAIVAYGIVPCGGCEAFDPILKETAAKYEHVRVGKAKMHVPGKCREIKKQHSFKTYPTTHFFSKGTLVLTREGKVEAEDLAVLIDQHLPGAN